MDYQNRAGSKKGGGGIASDSQQNLQRRRQVEELLTNGQNIPFSFQQDQEEAKLRAHPDIYRNHSGKLVCRLCNTMHVSWSSVERHLMGKRHQLNVLKRDARNKSKVTPTSIREQHFKEEVARFRAKLKRSNIKPDTEVVKVRHPTKDLMGIAVKVHYPKDKQIKTGDKDDEFIPYIRVISNLELTKSEASKASYLVIAFEPFQNVGIQLPNGDIELNDFEPSQPLSIDELNRKCSYWDQDKGDFYVQLYFRNN